MLRARPQVPAQTAQICNAAASRAATGSAEGDETETCIFNIACDGACRRR